MKVLGSTKSKVRKSEYGEIVPHLETTTVILIHYNIVTNSYQQDSRVLYTFVPNKSFGQLLNISTKTLYFQKPFTQNFHILKHGLRIKMLNL